MRIVSMPRMRQVVWRQARFEEEPLVFCGSVRFAGCTYFLFFKKRTKIPTKPKDKSLNQPTFGNSFFLSLLIFVSVFGISFVFQQIQIPFPF